MLPMSFLVGARAMLAELEQRDELELRRGPALARKLAALVEGLGRAPRGSELEEFLEAQPQVDELFASLETLEESAHRHFAGLFVAKALVEAHHPELEAQLLANLDQPDAYLVYADWLQEQGDPLGELIALGVAADSGGDSEQARAGRFLAQHRDHLLGGAAKAPAERLTLHWRYGLVHRVEASKVDDVELWRQLLSRPVARFVQHVELGAYRGGAYEGADYDAEVFELLGAGLARSLRSLTLHRLGTLELPPTLLDSELRELALIDGHRLVLPPRWPPRLERLCLDVAQLALPEGRQLGLADGAREPVALPIRQLRLRATEQTDRWLALLQLDELASLELDVGGCQDVAKAIERLLGDRELPALHALTVTHGRADGTVVSAVAALDCAPQLCSLGLTGLQLRDAAMVTLLRERERFERLEALDISDNELTAAGVESAREVAAKVESRRQDRAGTARHGKLRRFAGSRFEVARGIADPDGEGWLETGQQREILWARYRGGARYELWVQRDLRGFRCSCPSSIQPCKHVVALLLIDEQSPLPHLSAPFDLQW
jgi:uncharacterized protein (TIGR02996 family)